MSVFFDALQFSTIGADDIESQMNFDDLRGCDHGVTTFTGTSTNIWVDIIPKRCLPSLAWLPSPAWDPDDWNITDINPLWATCTPIGGVVFYPPRVLTPVDAVSPRISGSSPRNYASLTRPGVVPMPSITASATKAADPTTRAALYSKIQIYRILLSTWDRYGFLE